jgi:CBS domain-containing protein
MPSSMLLLVASIAGASAFHVSLLPRPETLLAPLRVPQPYLSAAAPTSPGLIKDFMTPTAEAVVLSPDMALREAADLLVSKKLTGAPVVEGGKLVGVLSQFDFLFKAAGTASLDLASDSYRADVQKILSQKVRSAMTLNPATYAPDDTVQSAAALMIRRRFNHVPIVDESGTVVGILRSTDVMEHVLSTF